MSSTILSSNSTATVPPASFLNEVKTFCSSQKVQDLLIADHHRTHKLAAWNSAVQKSLDLVPGLVDYEQAQTKRLAAAAKHDKDAAALILEEAWNTIFGLCKGAYQAQEGNDFPSKETMHVAPKKSSLCFGAAAARRQPLAPPCPQDGALHAILGLHQLACLPQRALAIWLVVQRLIHHFPLQLYYPSAARGRLPLHVICATAPATKARQALLCTVLQARPEVAWMRDAAGIYPLHLACQAGYPMYPTLELLWSMAPTVAELPCPCCPPALRWEHERHEELLLLTCGGLLSSNSVSSGSSSLCTSVTLEDADDDDTSVEHDTTISIDPSSLETVYSVPQSDPYLTARSAVDEEDDLI